MDIKQGQKVAVVMPPEYLGFIAKEAFTILSGTYINATPSGLVLVKIEFKDSQAIKETVISVGANQVFISLKDAIDASVGLFEKNKSTTNDTN